MKRITAVLLVALAPLMLYAAIFSGKCVGVTDGDTISVMKDGASVKIRLDGIDCPESGQDFGTRAKQFTSDLVFNKTVEVEQRDVDRYGRIVARVYVDGKDLSYELVQAGLAWHYKQYSNDSLLAAAEIIARHAKVGLWSQSNPIAPWDFRHGTSQATERSESTPNTVYVTNTGKKYHNDGCRYLSKSKNPILLADAQAQGYTPCKVCFGSNSSITKPETKPQQKASDEIVYITKTGSKYHRSGCSYLRKSAIPISKKDAIARGYGACSRCRP